MNVPPAKERFTSFTHTLEEPIKIESEVKYSAGFSVEAGKIVRVGITAQWPPRSDDDTEADVSPMRQSDPTKESGIIVCHPAGHFEVDQRAVEVPDRTDLAEAKRRLVGRSVVDIEEFLDGYALRLDDGQVVEFLGIWHNDSTAGTWIRFWKKCGGFAAAGAPA